MGKRGPGDQSAPQPPFGNQGDGQWHMGNFLREGQERANDASAEAYLHNRPAVNDAGGNVQGQQNMGAFLNANKKK